MSEIAVFIEQVQSLDSPGQYDDLNANLMSNLGTLGASVSTFNADPYSAA